MKYRRTRPSVNRLVPVGKKKKKCDQEKKKTERNGTGKNSNMADWDDAAAPASQFWTKKIGEKGKRKLSVDRGG